MLYSNRTDRYVKRVLMRYRKLLIWSTDHPGGNEALAGARVESYWPDHCLSRIECLSKRMCNCKLVNRNQNIWICINTVDSTIPTRFIQLYEKLVYSYRNCIMSWIIITPVMLIIYCSQLTSFITTKMSPKNKMLERLSLPQKKWYFVRSC